MRTAIVYDYVPGLGGGAERVLLELVSHFPSDTIEIFFGFVVDSPFSQSFIKEIQKRIGEENVHLGPKVRFLKPIMFRIMNFLLPAFLHEMNLKDFDLVISYTAFLSHAVIPPVKGRHILYSNTPARFLWNLDHAYSILKQISAPLLITDIMRFRSQMYDLDGIGRIQKILTISKAVQDRVSSFYNKTSDILYPAAVPDELLKVDYFNQELQNELGTYFASVSRIESYKNIDLAIDLFLKHNLPERLIIMGYGPHLPALKAKVRKLKKSKIYLKSLDREVEQYGNIIFTGFIEEGKKMQVLATASASFSLNDEDFGITKVEPLALGTPVIGLNAGATPEIITDHVNGILFEENTVESLLEAIKKHRKMNYKKDTLKQSAKKFTVSAFHTNLDTILNA
ncbi:glycosyltransferase [bacterium]|nr:glycosyltransferase [bacterium]